VPRLIAVLIACFALVFAACGDDKESEATPTPTEAAATDTATPEATAQANEFVPEGCESVEKPQPKDVGELEKPIEKLDKAKKYVAKVVTSCGEFDIALDAKRAPITGGSFKYLADKKFFDGTTFHRIVPEFVIQGGDPQGTGEGGPGYSVEEAPPSDLTYDKYVVAMAKTQTEPAGTSGSQFFVVTGDQAGSLTPDYALLGKVTKGKDVVDRIGGIQADGNGTPAAPVIIKSITVSER
jgi:cyclophilin family peptidyl-prolyl cis-trans isomerase